MYIDLVGLGGRVHEQRMKRHMTLNALGDSIGTSAAFVNHLERGRRCPSLETVVRLCRCFGVSLDYLVVGESKGCDRARCPLLNDLEQWISSYPR